MNGSRVNVSIGNPTLVANATVILSGNRLNISTSDVTTLAKARTIPTGSRLNIANSDVEFRIWDGVVTGANQTWIPL